MTLFVLSLCPYDISAGVGAFVIGLSQISSFLSQCTRIVTVTNFYECIYLRVCLKEMNMKSMYNNNKFPSKLV